MPLLCFYFNITAGSCQPYRQHFLVYLQVYSAKMSPKWRIFHYFLLIFAFLGGLLISGPRVRVPEGAPKKDQVNDLVFFWYLHKIGTRGEARQNLFCRRSADSTADLTAIDFCCQPCALLKARVPEGAPYATLFEYCRVRLCFSINKKVKPFKVCPFII